MAKQLNVPKKRGDLAYVSYSQISSYLSESSFNLGIEGRLEYIISYMMGVNFPDQGWGEYGNDVEAYICYKDFSKAEIEKLDEDIRIKNKKYPDRPEKLISECLASFTEEEKKKLDKIEPLGVYQQEGWINFDGFKLLLYIDDATEGFKKLRDYKTASESSSQQYYTDKYKQLIIYSIWVKQEMGYYPDELEVTIVERGGNCFGMVERRDLLFVKDRVWTVDRSEDIKKCDDMKVFIQKTAEEIADLKTTYDKLSLLEMEL